MNRALWLALALALAGCTSSVAPARSLVGAVDGTDAYVALVATDARFVAYVCDSQRVALWVEGALDAEGRFEQTVAGATLRGALGPDGATGTLTLAGVAHDFAASDASAENAGLWAADVTTDAEVMRGGWVVRDTGEQRGAFVGRTSGAVTPASTLTFRAGIATTDEGAVSHEIVSP